MIVESSPLAITSKGTYILILKLNHEKSIQVGKLGKFKFAPGFYAYIGSAFGPGGLAGRLNHHFKLTTKPFWHIDYLRKFTSIEQVWFSDQHIRREHDWAKLMNQMDGGSIGMKGFGCTDCRCETHLFYCSEIPSIGQFQKLISNYFSNDASTKLLSV